jgi:hypothetical protein
MKLSTILQIAGSLLSLTTAKWKRMRKESFRGADDDNGPNIAWFKDPAGNFVSVIEN